MSLRRYCEAEPGPRPPSSRGLDQSVMTLAGSRSYMEPRPWHSGQAPKVELKEKLRGSSLGTSRPQSGQAMEEEKSCSSCFWPPALPERTTRARPLAICRAFPTAASRRFSTGGLPEGDGDGAGDWGSLFPTLARDKAAFKDGAPVFVGASEPDGLMRMRSMMASMVWFLRRSRRRGSE